VPIESVVYTGNCPSALDKIQNWFGGKVKGTT
jgi:hypothetical protein